jgi:hypothetical protein
VELNCRRRRDDESGPMALRITKTGLEAIGIEDVAVDAPEETSVRPAPAQGEVEASRKRISVATQKSTRKKHHPGKAKTKAGSRPAISCFGFSLTGFRPIIWVAWMPKVDVCSMARRLPRRQEGLRSICVATMQNSAQAPCSAANGTARCNGWRYLPMGTAPSRPSRAKSMASEPMCVSYAHPIRSARLDVGSWHI